MVVSYLNPFTPQCHCLAWVCLQSFIMNAAHMLNTFEVMNMLTWKGFVRLSWPSATSHWTFSWCMSAQHCPIRCSALSSRNSLIWCSSLFPFCCCCGVAHMMEVATSLAVCLLFSDRFSVHFLIFCNAFTVNAAVRRARIGPCTPWHKWPDQTTQCGGSGRVSRAR